MSKTVLVTGASSGIGAAIANLLHQSGFNVFGTSRSAKSETVNGIQMLALDVDSDDSVQRCIAEVIARAGHLDVLVNNAGFALFGAVEETSLHEAKAQFETNFFGVVRTVRAVLPSMRQTGSGKIVIIGSLAGLTALPFQGFYSATKFALEGYSEALWHEVSPLGISVSLIEPGFVRTPISQAARAATTRLPAYEATRQRVENVVKTAVDAGLNPELVAKTVLQVAQSQSPRLRYPVGSDAHWLPRLRNAIPWNLFASGVRRRFEITKAA